MQDPRFGGGLHFGDPLGSADLSKGPEVIWQWRQDGPAARLGASAGIPGPRRERCRMSLSQLIYASRPFGFDAAMLAGILLDARRCNTRDGVTGLLICRADLYLQLLEGPAPVLEATYARIAADDRHMELRLLVQRSASVRLFPEWAMRDDPARSWLWSKSEVEEGALDRATEDEILAVFRRSAAEDGAP